MEPTEKAPSERHLTPTESFSMFYETIYRDKVYDLYQNYPDVQSLIVDYRELDVFNPDLGDLLEINPTMVIKAAEKALSKLNPNNKKTITPHVRIINYSYQAQSLRYLRSANIGNYVSVDGLVRKMTPVIPTLRIALFECRNCMRLHEMPQREPGKLIEPAICQECGGHSFRLLKEESEYGDLQIITIQEPHEQLKGKEQPRQMRILIRDDLCDKVAPGELVRVNGVLDTQKRDRATYEEFYIKGNHLETLVKEYEEVKITPKDKEAIIKLSKDPNLYQRIIDSTAPIIEGFDTFKEAVALQLFGGAEVEFENTDVTVRSNIHILIIGDPGIGKSQVLKYISKIAPGGIFASGKGASGVGLTAAVVSDDAGGWTLEAGALVLGDRGFVCIDEFDKMKQDDRDAIHEALEQGTISVYKASIQATLMARCSVLAAANPKYSRFTPYKSIPDQLNLPASLLSRFDLIFIAEDHPNQDKDRRVAKHICQLRRKEALEYSIDPLLLKKYIAYARQNYKPKLTKEAENYMIDHYVALRNIVSDEKDSPVTITPRQFEALFRLAAASAKIHLRNEIQIEDVDRVIKLQNECMKHVGYDPDSGQVDIDRVEGLTSTKERKNIFLKWLPH